MILASSSFLPIVTGILITLEIVLALLLILLVMMQRPKQEGLGAAFGGTLTDQAFGARTTDVLQKGTVYISIAFLVVTLLLSISRNAGNKGSRLLQAGEKQKAEQAATAPASAKLEPVKAETQPVPASKPAAPTQPVPAQPTPSPTN